MKWTLFITVIFYGTGADWNRHRVEDHVVPGWSNQATCEEARARLIQDHAQDSTTEVRASCARDSTLFVLPTPR